MTLPPLVWPKNPKISDLVTVIDQLIERLDHLDAFEAQHSAGTVKRQQEVDQLRADNERMRWAMKTGRRP